MQELLENIDESTLNLDAIETRVPRDLRSTSEILDELLDVLKGHLPRAFAHSRSALYMNPLLGIDGRGTKG